MANTITTKGTLQLTLLDSNGNSDLLFFDNAKASIAAADIDSLSSFIADKALLVSSSGYPVIAISDAKVIRNKHTELDLS